MNSPEDRRGMTRRDLLKRVALVAGAASAVEWTAIGILKHVENINRIKELEASLYFERLKNTILQIQTGKDRKSEALRDIYLGNVNHFDRISINVSRGSAIVTTTTGPETVITIDSDGQQTTETRGEKKETTEFQFFIPSFLTDITNDKKSSIKILYLDSGANHPFRSSFDQAGNLIQDNVRELMPGINVNVVEQKIIPWDPNTQVYFHGVTGNIEEDEIRDGKFRLSDKYRYLIFTERPLQAYFGNFSEHAEAGGSSIRQNNIAVVNLFNYKHGDSLDINRAALQEIGHSYGLDHCWEDNCAMSYKVALGYTPYIIPSSYGSRCSMIGRNIADGHIEEVRDPKNPMAYFASARLAPEDIARQNFEEHLVGYLSDIAGKIPAGVKSHSTVGKDQDIVTFSMHNRSLATVSVKEFISTIITA